MKTLWWRIRFTYSMCHIILNFEPHHIKSSWEFSKSTKYKHLPPYKAILNEIADWYS